MGSDRLSLTRRPRRDGGSRLECDGRRRIVTCVTSMTFRLTPRGLSGQRITANPDRVRNGTDAQ